MKVVPVSIALLSAVTAVAAAAHVHHHPHRRAFLPKRAKVTVTDDSYTKPTEVPEVVVYVDQYGKPVRTATETVVVVPGTALVQSTQAAQSVDSVASTPPAVPASSSQAPPPPPPPPPPAASVSSAPSSAPAPLEDPKPSSVSVPQPIPTSASVSKGPKPSSSAVSSPPSSGGNLNGVTYSPYKGSGGCKTASEVDSEFAVFAKDHGVIRLYGVDCNQVASAYAASKKYGNKLMLGIFDIDTVPQAVLAMAKGVGNDWSVVDTVTVGNELVNNGAATVDKVVSAMGQARSALRSAGYIGPVVTVDTFVAAINHPELCNESDYCAVNMHPFFDGNVGAEQAGFFMTTQIARIRSKLSDQSKRIVITETGWPWKGQTNGAAVPSMNNQATAISSIKGAFQQPGDVFLFTAFNDMWKAPGPFGAEQYWGMGGRFSLSDN